MPAVHPAFQCVVISPLGKLLECQTISAVLPAHDGEVGIWHNHVPMLCKLGMGIMKVAHIPLDIDTPPSETLLFIDGGFALLAKNILTIIAFEAISPRDTKFEKMQRIIDRAEKSAAGAVTQEQRLHYLKKSSILKQFVQRQNLEGTVETTGEESRE